MVKKILVIGMSGSIVNGINSVIINYYRNIDRQNIHFDFLCASSNFAYKDEIESLGGRILFIPPATKKYFKYKKTLKNIYKNGKYDAVWINQSELVNITHINLAKKYKVKIRIMHSHSTKIATSGFIKKFLRYIIHQINKLKIKKLATDYWACGLDAGKWFYGKNIEKNPQFKIINNAIDVDKFTFNPTVRTDYRKELGLIDKFVIGNVGRLHIQKNQEFLINVFNLIYKQNSSARLILIGNGPLENKLKDQISRLGLTEYVKLLGARNDINNLLQAIDVFALPSKYEGLPVVLLEAQASGLPVVVSNNVTSEALITDNCEQADINDENLFAKKILKYQSKIIDRSKANAKIKNAGYDIKQEANKLTGFLING